MEHKIEDQVREENRKSDYELSERISSDSLSLAISEVYSRQKSNILKTPKKLKNIRGRFGDLYTKRRDALAAKCNLQEGSRKIANEYEIVALYSRNWWRAAIEHGIFPDNEYTRQFTKEDSWWKDSGSKAYAFYDHMQDKERIERLRPSFAECENDAELIALVFDIYFINLLADIDMRAPSMSQQEMLDEIFELFDVESFAQFSIGWNQSDELIREDISRERKTSALMRLEKDPTSRAKQAAKMAIKSEWEKIPKLKKTYGWKANFAKKMGAEHHIIQDVKTITGWVAEWEKLLTS